MVRVRTVSYAFSYEKALSNRPFRHRVDPFAVVPIYPKGPGKTARASAAYSSAAETTSQLIAENRSIEGDDDAFVYRRLGNTQTGTPPLLCLQHYCGNSVH